MFKSGFVAIVGRPNVGKSTLLNRIMKRKVSITSSKVQTTRNNIRGILTDKESQIVFVDTPGIHKPRNNFGELMNSSAWSSTKDCEVILFLTESNTELGPGDKIILDYVSKNKASLFIVISKCDITSKEQIANKIRSIQEYEGVDEVIPISAEVGTNIDLLINLIKKKLPEGPQFFDAETTVDQNSEFIIGELIREQVLHKTREEIPHGAAAMVEKMIYDRKKDLWIINGLIFVNRESHKRILVGRAGSMIAKISHDARSQIKHFLKKPVYLKLFVKVKEKWQTDDDVIKIYGYGK